MKNTTNVLLMVVIILLFALWVDKKVETNNLKADGAINNVIMVVDPIMKERFYLVSTEQKNIMYYEYDQGTKSILLRASRQYEYDQQVQGFYKSVNNPGDPYINVKKYVEEQGRESPRKK